MMKLELDGEDLAYWYLRLNGFMTIRNFIVHPEYRRDGAGTDADIVGVRLPFRRELQRQPLRDDDWVEEYHRQQLLVIAEVKTGLCRLNGPWTTPGRQNMEKVLSAIGAFPEGSQDDAAQALYKRGSFTSHGVVVLLLAFGGIENQDLRQSHPSVKQIVWSQAETFIFSRFSTYHNEKSWHQPWDKTGEALYELAQHARTADSFTSQVAIRPRAGGPDPITNLSQ